MPRRLVYLCCMPVFDSIRKARSAGAKQLALLVDPDGADSRIAGLEGLITAAGVDYVFVGGSLLTDDVFHQTVQRVKEEVSVPVVLFPGSPAQLSDHADALLFLSLISGRNPDLLIGQHVQAASRLSRMRIEVIPTGYMLVDCGIPTTASYISNTPPLPHDKPGIAAMTALAGQYLGLQLMYLDGGSGAQKPVAPEMITAVRSQVQCPLIVGGGIRTADQARAAWAAGADLIVVGTAWEQNPDALLGFRSAARPLSTAS
jgi:phosphoglycerol geranylgeranyltransferase